MLSYLENINNYCEKLSISPSKQSIYVSISTQKLFFFNDNVLEKCYNISTSRKPPSCIENSFGTPTGLHKIEQKIGCNVPEGMIFKGRVPIGKFYWDEGPETLKPGSLLITSRILWLKGLQTGINAGPGIDSFNRFIYIHGTNNEAQIGKPLSQGCVLLKNNDILELHNKITVNSLVLIN